MTYAKGLEGVVAGETAISNVEGEIGRLSYRGYSIEELVDQDYVAVMYLLLFGDLPDEAQREALNDFLMAEGALDAFELRVLEEIPTNTHSMMVLQAMIPILGTNCEPRLPLDGEGHAGLKIVAKLPAVIATYRALQLGRRVPAFDSTQSYLGNFLQMFTGAPPIPEHEEILSAVEILQMEHSFNAGTFAARVVASTLAPVAAALAAGVGALAGSLHGGADEAALRDAKQVGEVENVSTYLDNLLNNNGKLMGMGHREYRIVDPRAVILKPMAAALCTSGSDLRNYQTLEALERDFNQRMKAKGRDIWANVEFYKGAVFEAIAIPEHYFTAMFALARSVGWLSHFIESRADNKLIRPKALYVGEEARSIA